MFETKVIAAGPASIDEVMQTEMADGTWEIKGVAVTQPFSYGKESGVSSPMIRVFLQRPGKPSQQRSLEDAGQTVIFCGCEAPLGVIGSNKCKRCHGIIKDKQ